MASIGKEPGIERNFFTEEGAFARLCRSKLTTTQFAQVFLFLVEVRTGVDACHIFSPIINRMEE